MRLCQEIGCIEKGFGYITQGGSVRIYCHKHYEENLYDIIDLEEEFDEQDESGNLETEPWQSPLVFPTGEDF